RFGVSEHAVYFVPDRPLQTVEPHVARSAAVLRRRVERMRATVVLSPGRTGPHGLANQGGPTGRAANPSRQQVGVATHMRNRTARVVQNLLDPVPGPVIDDPR